MPDTAYFIQQGLGWAVSVVLSGVIVYLSHKIDTKDALYISMRDTLSKEKFDITEQRRVDSIENTKEVINVMHDVAQSSAILAAKIEVIHSGSK